MGRYHRAVYCLLYIVAVEGYGYALADLYSCATSYLASYFGIFTMVYVCKRINKKGRLNPIAKSLALGQFRNKVIPNKKLKPAKHKKAAINE